MNDSYYQSFYDQVGKLNGWNFDKLKVISEGEKWDFYNEVSRKCTNSDLLLDIGTGGGEKVLAIADTCRLLVGIDQSAGMIHTANNNLQRSQKLNVQFLQMDAEVLAFPNHYFNIVSCRQSPFHADEVARILKEDGVFLTQQISENDKKNLSEAFGRGQSANADGTLKNKYIAELYNAGFTDVQSFEYDVAEYYETAEDLIFLLKHTPIIPHFGQNEADFVILNKFIKEYETEKGIETNSKRFMIIAKK